MTDTPTTVDPQQVSAGFRSMFEGKLPDDKMQSGLTQIGSSVSGYSANGSIASVVIWMKCQCQCNGKTFDGSSWGIAFPGGGALFGTVYTSDINALFSNTETFAFTATPVYTAFYFFDGDHNLLGTFQAGSVSTVGGQGGGKGSWS